jgi:molybdopterin molybdotransferase
VPTSITHVRDDPEITRQVIEKSLEACDILITTGGVSVGEADYVKPAMMSLGWEIHFDQVAIKPGKPTCFGTQGTQIWFGLPGNPVSALVTFHHFVRAAIRRIMCHPDGSPQLRQAVLSRSLHKKSGRLEFVRGRAEAIAGGLTVEPHHGRDSHMLSSLAGSNCLIRFPAEAEQLLASDPVEIEMLPW